MNQSGVLAPATISTSFLPRTEVYRLFTSIWQSGPDAYEARETIIQDNLKAVRNFILNYPTTYWYDMEDAQQEAYLLLTVSLDKVPPYTENPGAYLYTIACRAVRDSCSHSIRELTSLDAIIPGTESVTLHDVVTAPTVQTATDPTPLYAALHRLPLGQQHALQSFFQLADFHPHLNSRRTWCSNETKGIRSLAYRELRRDTDLQASLNRHSNRARHLPIPPLKKYRCLHGWSQGDVAEAIGVSASLVCRWEAGKRQPGASACEKLCQLYGVTADQLGLREA